MGVLCVHVPLYEYSTRGLECIDHVDENALEIVLVRELLVPSVIGTVRGVLQSSSNSELDPLRCTVIGVS